METYRNIRYTITHNPYLRYGKYGFEVHFQNGIESSDSYYTQQDTEEAVKNLIDASVKVGRR